MPFAVLAVAFMVAFTEAPREADSYRHLSPLAA